MTDMNRAEHLAAFRRQHDWLMAELTACRRRTPRWRELRARAAQLIRESSAFLRKNSARA